MDIRELLLQEHSKVQTRRIVDFIGNDRDRFALLMKLFLGKEYRVTQRAAWVISGCAELYPELFRPYIQAILENIRDNPVHDAVKRNTLRVLQFAELPAECYAVAIEVCFTALSCHAEPVAVKAHAMTVLSRICNLIPELKTELRLRIETQMEYQSPAFTSRGRKILKELGKN